MIRGTPTKITADVAIGGSGKPVRVYAVSLKSGATASVLTLRNGTGTGDAALAEIVGTVNVGITQDLGEGLLFPSGCYADVDANIDYATIWWERVTT